MSGDRGPRWWAKGTQGHSVLLGVGGPWLLRRMGKHSKDRDPSKATQTGQSRTHPHTTLLPQPPVPTETPADLTAGLGGLSVNASWLCTQEAGVPL